jgi:DNA-binding MarR family transcriptional regulator
MSVEPIRALVQVGLAIHNLNKAAEQRLGLSLVQCHVLSALLELPGCSQQELALASGVHPSTLTQTLKILERKGFIFVDEHPKDSRKKILLATRQGKVARRSFEAGIERVLAQLSPAHRESVKGMVRA